MKYNRYAIYKKLINNIIKQIIILISFQKYHLEFLCGMSIFIFIFYYIRII